jgi:hypothetical protein
VNTAEDFEQAARLWQQYWDRLRFGSTLDIEHSKSCVPGVGNSVA